MACNQKIWVSNKNIIGVVMRIKKVSKHT